MSKTIIDVKHFEFRWSRITRNRCKTETLTFKSKTSTDLDIKNTLKFDRPFDCVDFELYMLLFKSCYKTWSENEVLKHGLTTTLSTPGI